MVESSPSRQRRPPCKTNKEMADEAADTAALVYLLTYFFFVTLQTYCSGENTPLFYVRQLKSRGPMQGLTHTCAMTFLGLSSMASCLPMGFKPNVYMLGPYHEDRICSKQCKKKNSCFLFILLFP